MKFSPNKLFAYIDVSFIFIVMINQRLPTVWPRVEYQCIRINAAPNMNTNSHHKYCDTKGIIQGDFFNWDSPENVSRLAPPKFAWTGPPPNFSKCWNHIHFARHLGVFRSEGGPVWDSNVFLKSVTYRPTLSKFSGGPFKKITLYIHSRHP